MPFDPSQPFEPVDDKPAFNESQPFETVAVAEFDPSQPFEEVAEEPAPAKPEERGFVSGALAGMARGAGGIISDIGGLVAGPMRQGVAKLSFGMSEAVGEPYTAAGKWLREQGESISGKPSLAPSPSVAEGGVFNPGNPRWWTERSAEFVPQLAAQLGLAIATKSPAAFMASGGAQMAGNAYNDAIDDYTRRGDLNAETEKLAATEAGVVGVIGGLLEKIPGAEFLTSGPISKALSSVIRSRLVRRGIGGFFAEGTSETLQEMATDMAALGFRDDADRMKDAAARYAGSFALGGIPGAGAGVLTTPNEIAKEDVDTAVTDALNVKPDEAAPLPPKKESVAPLITAEVEALAPKKETLKTAVDDALTATIVNPISAPAETPPAPVADGATAARVETPPNVDTEVEVTKTEPAKSALAEISKRFGYDIPLTGAPVAMDFETGKIKTGLGKSERSTKGVSVDESLTPDQQVWVAAHEAFHKLELTENTGLAQAVNDEFRGTNLVPSFLKGIGRRTPKNKPESFNNEWLADNFANWMSGKMGVKTPAVDPRLVKFFESNQVTPESSGPATTAAETAAVSAPARDATKPEQMTPEEFGIIPRETGPAPNSPSSAEKRFGKLGLQSEYATPEAVARWKAEKKAYADYHKRAKRRTEVSNRYWALVADAVQHGRPISEGAIQYRYSGDIPPNYVKRGDLYVFEGDATPAASTQTVEGVQEPRPVASSEQSEPDPSAKPEIEVSPPPLPKSSPKLGLTAGNKLFDWITKNARRLFTAEGNLPKETFERWQNREGQVKSVTRDIAYNTRDLYNALQKVYRISSKERFASGFARVPQADVQNINDALLGTVQIASLDPELQPIVMKMRNQIDTLSQTMLNEGMISGDLAATVGDNLGVYLTRSYRIFDDPKWAEKIPVPVRNQARAFLLSELRTRNPAATDADAERLMQSMLADWKQRGDQRGRGGKLGSKDLSIFIRRKDIAPELRSLMGEYKNPVINYARSVSKMANLIGNQRFLNDVRAQGMGTWLFEDGTEPAGFSEKIAADESDVMAPLNGLRTTPEIAEAFREFGKVQRSDNPIFRAYMGLTSIAKGAKTVGSLMTQARNLFGQVYFFGMNGHFDLRPARKAIMGTAADIGAVSDRHWRDYYKRMLDLGVVDQSTKANELRDTLRDAGLNDASLDEFNERRLAKNIRKVTLDAATRSYQISDDVGKVIGFENERARQAEINPGWTPEQVDAEAARRIRLTYPTYSMVPEWIKQWRRQPFFGPFMTFAYETFRTTGHALNFTVQDLKSSNPAARKAGMQRLAGQLAVIGGGYAIAATSRALLGMRADEEDDSRKFAAPWDRNAQLMFTDKDDDGSLNYVNLSYANPYSYLTDPVTAVLTGARSDDEIVNIIGKSFTELMRPFFGENILASAMVDVARNKTQTGREVYNHQDSLGAKSEAVLNHITKALEPGTLTRAKKKIAPALRGETTPYGQALDPVREIAAEVSGFRLNKLDYRQGLGFKASRFKRDEKESENIMREVVLRRGTVQPDEIAESIKRSEESRFRVWKDLHESSRASIRRGVPEAEARSILRSRGVSSSDAADILAGRYRPYRATDDMRKRLREIGREVPAVLINPKPRPFD